MRKKFQTANFRIDPQDAEDYARRFDGNPVHLPGNFNEVLPKGTVPGLLVASFSFKQVLQLPEFKEILCAKEAKVKFISPVFGGDELFVRGDYEDSPHRSRPGVIFRDNLCEVVNAKTQEIVMRYELTQLLRASSLQRDKLDRP